MEMILYRNSEGKTGVYYDPEKFKNYWLEKTCPLVKRIFLSPEQIQEIEKATYASVDGILSKYVN